MFRLHENEKMYSSYALKRRETNRPAVKTNQNQNEGESQSHLSNTK